MSEISRIVSNLKPKVAVQLKLTDECCAALQKAANEKKNVRIIYEPSYCVIQIGYDNIDFLSFTCAASAVKDSSVDALKCVDGKYELLSSVGTRIQVNATDKTFAATREKSQKLKDEQDKKKAKDVVHTKSRSATSKTKPVLSTSNTKNMTLSKVSKPVAPLKSVKREPEEPCLFQRKSTFAQPHAPKQVKMSVAQESTIKPTVKTLDVSLEAPKLRSWKLTSDVSFDTHQFKIADKPSCDWTIVYDEIKDEKGAREYREEYDAEFSNYQSLYDYLSNVQKEFSVYDSQLKQIRSRQEHEKKNNEVQRRFSELQLDDNYLKNRNKHATSRAKLEVLRKRIEDWNRGALFEF